MKPGVVKLSKLSIVKLQNSSAIVETKIGSSFPDSQFLLEKMKKRYRLDVTSRKSLMFVFVNNDIPSKYLQNFHLLSE